jgi:hypothetical protein
VSLATSAYDLAREGFTTVAEAIGVDSSLDDAVSSEPAGSSLLEEALAEETAVDTGKASGAA